MTNNIPEKQLIMSIEDCHYKYIVENILLINTTRLKEYKPTIVTRLKSASKIMIKERGKDDFSQSDLFGINRCIHLASSIVLLCVKDQYLSKVVKSIREDKGNDGILFFPKEDATTVLTIATLFYTLYDYAKPKKIIIEKDFNTICEHFDEVNWVIGLEGATKLGITQERKLLTTNKL